LTILTKNQIWNKLYAKKNKLVITPLLDDIQVGLASVDLRLATSFIIFQSRRIRTIEPSEETDEKIRTYQEHIVFPYGGNIILQPNEFVLGCTLEYLKLPKDLLGYVLGRSSWGRLGLVIETSPVVQPCFSGVLTLELTNLGTSPISLNPGSRIAQISFHTSNEKEIMDCEKVNEKRKYSLGIYPEFSKIYTD